MGQFSKDVSQPHINGANIGKFLDPNLWLVLCHNFVLTMFSFSFSVLIEWLNSKHKGVWYFYGTFMYFCGTFVVLLFLIPIQRCLLCPVSNLSASVEGAVGITAVMSCALFGGLANWHLIHLSVWGTPNFSLVTQLCGGCPRIFSITAGSKFDLTAKHHKSCGNAIWVKWKWEYLNII